MRFHQADAPAFDPSKLLQQAVPELRMAPPNEVDMYEDCKEVSVVHVPQLKDHCKTDEKIPHITENISDFPAKESVNLIKYFQLEPGKRSSQTLRSRAKGEFIFESMREDMVYYEEIRSGGTLQGQREVTVRGNYVAGTETVTFKCIGIAVFGHDDLD